MADKVFQVIVVALECAERPGLDSRYILPNVQRGFRSESHCRRELAYRKRRHHLLWRHSAGWSAERRVDNRTIYMTPVSHSAAPPPAAPNTDDVLRRRTDPEHSRERQHSPRVTGVLYLGQRITAEPTRQRLIGAMCSGNTAAAGLPNATPSPIRCSATTVKPGVPASVLPGRPRWGF
ncbi:MAG: hypothetical protein IPK17_38945 [Chloroflexi bacterium]|uniref:hypothetical protein n=1 Tax=Candidatus Flexifilum breve TaxID=3140694 RepID=UPI0031347984|nr:hypothetical protein [Chloroflexota bacterium]